MVHCQFQAAFPRLIYGQGDSARANYLQPVLFGVTGPDLGDQRPVRTVLGDEFLKVCAQRHVCQLSASHPARCTARYGVGSHPDATTMECPVPVG
jgi:hypothetical protein